MKVLFIGDPHLKIGRFDLAVSFLTWLNKLIVEQKPDLVVNLGDTFDTHAVLRSEVLNEFMNHVYQVLRLDIPYVYLVEIGPRATCRREVADHPVPPNATSQGGTPTARRSDPR